MRQRMDRRTLLKWMSGAAASAWVGGAVEAVASDAAPIVQPAMTPKAAAGRPNLIFLLSDDQRWNTLGCMDTPVVRTPQLDLLAERGTLFTHACVTTAICCVSRASILTGQHMARHGIRDFATTFTPEAAAQTYPQVLRAAGYYTGYIGKYGVGAQFDAAGFDFARGTAQLDAPFTMDANGQPVHTLVQTARDAREFFEAAPRDRPYCLAVGFNAPHAEDGNPEQYRVEKRDEQLYLNDSIPVPETATDASFKALPPFLQDDNEGRVRWGWRFDTAERYQQYVKAYYRLVTAMDRAVGQIRRAAEARGDAENTVIIFMGDNGYFLGEHGLADKWFPYEESIRVPLIVYDPRQPEERWGQRNDALVLNIDVAPTLLALAGLPAAPGMQGRDFSSMIGAATAPADWRQQFFYEHMELRASKGNIAASQALVAQGWKYIHWPGHAYEQLFDLRNDPLEQHDLARDPAHAEKLAELRQAFTEEKLKAQ